MDQNNPTHVHPNAVVSAFEHDPFAKVPEGWSLDTWQRALVAASALRRGKKVAVAAKLAGVSAITLWEWRKKAGWAEAEKFCEKQNLFELRGTAFDELCKLVTSEETNSHTKLQAIKFVLERTDAAFVDPKLKLGWDEGKQESVMAEFDGLAPDDLRALLGVLRSGVDVKALLAAHAPGAVIEVKPVREVVAKRPTGGAKGQATADQPILVETTEFLRTLDDVDGLIEDHEADELSEYQRSVIEATRKTHEAVDSLLSGKGGEGDD